MGSKIETRNILLLYHPELNSSRAITQVSYPALYSHYMEKMRLPATNLYPNDHRPIVIGMAVSNRRTHPAAGDIFTARELGNSLSSLFDVKVVYLDRGPGWYADTSELDILVAFLDAYEVPLVKLARPSLIVVAWMRNWFHRWLSKQWIGNFDMILVSSSVAAAFYMSFPTLPVQCHERCPPALALHRRRLEVHVDTLRIATNPLRFSPGAPSSKFRADYVFTGSYWEAHRDVMDFNPLNISEFKGVVIGANWHRAPVSKDTFDLELPTYTDMDDLTEKLRYFLTHDSAREELAKKLQQQVLSRHTYRNRAEEFASSVNNLFKQQVIKRLKVDLDNSTTSATLYTDDDHIIRPSETIRMSAGEIVSHSPNEKRVDMSCVEEETPAICVGVRTYAGG
ncbi:unnamed protein product [Symbiodinium microadriaticum]|nr:unnamed protein product [Symbiodinium microadriaticum]